MNQELMLLLMKQTIEKFLKIVLVVLYHNKFEMFLGKKHSESTVYLQIQQF